MPAGRPRKSTAAKRLAGTDRPDRRKKPDLSERLQKPPPHRLSKYAKVAWKRVAAAAYSLGTLRSTDLEALALLAETMGTEQTLREQIEREGMTVVTAAGNPKTHPAIAALQSTRAQMDKLLGHFGLTPIARGRLDVTPQRLGGRMPPLMGLDRPTLLAGGEPEKTLKQFLAEKKARNGPEHPQTLREFLDE